jgi:tRNA nucleotidyltransferase (CCA-adding enzyme)
MQEVLKLIKPDSKEEKRVEKIIKDFLVKLKKNLDEDASVVIGGSFAKGTWLKNTHDVDIFVIYSENKNISFRLKESLDKSFGKVDRIHGSRDYFGIKIKGLNFEIVPVFKITKSTQAKNITDVSPLHVKWVRSKLVDNLADDIRLAKMFSRAQGVYGAETFVKGFSGYALEILTIYYKGFENLLKASLKWKEGDMLNIENRKNVVLNKSKLSPLIIIDPVQENRNTSSALSKENMDKFVKAARLYLKKPSKKMFEMPKFDLGKVEKNDLVLKAMPLEGSYDNVGTKFMKVYEILEKRLTSEGFEIKDSGWVWDKHGYFWYSFKSTSLSKFREQVGPPLSKVENVRMFRDKHHAHKIVEREDKIYAVAPRRFVKLKDYVRYLLKNEREIIRRVRKIGFV